MKDRGFLKIYHVTIQRWVMRFSAVLETEFKKEKISRSKLENG